MPEDTNTKQFHNELQQDVQKLVSGKPQCKLAEYQQFFFIEFSCQLLVGKWFVGTPATEAKKRKNHEALTEKKRGKKPPPRVQPQRRPVAPAQNVDLPFESEDGLMDGVHGDPGGAEEFVVGSNSGGEDGGEADSEDGNKSGDRPSKKAK